MSFSFEDDDFCLEASGSSDSSFGDYSSLFLLCILIFLYMYYRLLKIRPVSTNCEGKPKQCL